MSCT